MSNEYPLEKQTGLELTSKAKLTSLCGNNRPFIESFQREGRFGVHHLAKPFITKPNPREEKNRERNRNPSHHDSKTLTYSFFLDVAGIRVSMRL